jgi:hypothetical protein
MAPRGKEFPLQPLPGDRTFCNGPSRGTGISAFRLMATPRDCSNILPEHAVALKGTIYEKCVYGGTILSKDYNIHILKICSSVKKKVDPGGATPGHRLRIRISRRNRTYIRKGFRVKISGLGNVFC